MAVYALRRFQACRYDVISVAIQVERADIERARSGKQLQLERDVPETERGAPARRTRRRRNPRPLPQSELCVCHAGRRDAGKSSRRAQVASVLPGPKNAGWPHVPQSNTQL
jgi:hypothetical protein